MKYPGQPRTTCSTPSAEQSIAFFGGNSHGPVTVSNTQFKALAKVYQFTDNLSRVETAREEHKKAHAWRVAKYEESKKAWNPEAPPKETPFDEKAVLRFLDAGVVRDVFRETERDGIRIMAFLAKFVEPGQDPVKLIVQMASDCGYDVDPADFEWSQEESETPERV